MLRGPFPELTEWIEENAGAAREEEYREYLHDVRYHLRRASEAERACLEVLRDFDWRAHRFVKSGDLKVTIYGFEPERLVHHGDRAIREARAALDVGFVLSNYVLDAGLRKNDVRPRSLREKLTAEFGDGAATVVEILRRIEDSIGFNLLKGYRNWVTHRGAPRVEVDPEIEKMIPLPDEMRLPVGEDADEEEIERAWNWQIEHRFLPEKIRESVRVCCHPFVPPVQMTLSAEIGRAPRDLELPGIKVGEGASVSIKNLRYTTGSLFEPADEFEAKNPVDLEAETRGVAGEELAVYSVGDYTQSVQRVVRFASDALSGEWDEVMTDFLVEDGS